MAKLLKEAKAKSILVEYYVKLFEEENGKFMTYANNTNFDWGWVRIFNTKEEAEKDFYNSLELFSHHKWEVK